MKEQIKTLEARQLFREGWIMLLRPFKFAELSEPLQKLTILYSYSERPIISRELNEKGKELLEEFYESYGKEGFLGGNSQYCKRPFESDNQYEERVGKLLDGIYEDHSTIEIYEGHIVQCYVEKQLCRFYPQEYNVIRKETFEAVLNDDCHDLRIENPTEFDQKEIKDRIHYIKSRGLSEEKAKHLSSGSLKDSIWFAPKMELLEMFCRPHEIF